MRKSFFPFFLLLLIWVLRASVHFIYDFYTLSWHCDLFADVKVQITAKESRNKKFWLWPERPTQHLSRHNGSQCFTVLRILNQEMEEFFSLNFFLCFYSFIKKTIKKNFARLFLFSSSSQQQQQNECIVMKWKWHGTLSAMNCRSNQVRIFKCVSLIRSSALSEYMWSDSERAKTKEEDEMTREGFEWMNHEWTVVVGEVDVIREPTVSPLSRALSIQIGWNWDIRDFAL